MPRITVIIPSYNEPELLEKCLVSLTRQTNKDFTVLVVDDCSTNPAAVKVAEKYYPVIQTPRNSGPSKARNLGIQKAETDLLAFTDSDCEVSHNWIESILSRFEDKSVDAIMGYVSIPRSNYIGNSISCLGFPAGGWPGYKIMYDIGDDNLSTHLSTCNCALRKRILDEIGVFDEDFPAPGREDTEFSVRLVNAGYTIRYCSDVSVSHIARTSIKSLFKMNVNRGRGTYHLKRKIPTETLEYYKKLRYKTTFKVFAKYLFTAWFPMIVFLTLVSYIGLRYGNHLEKHTEEIK